MTREARRSLSKLSFCSALLATVVGCTEIKVSSQATPGADVSHATTYAWRDTPGRLPPDPRIDRQALDHEIRSEIERSLGERGFRPVTAGSKPANVSYNL